MIMRKKTYMLVHGAWHASWCWKTIEPLLVKHGHEVLTPNLPGHGQHTAPFPTISLQNYVDHISNLIQLCNQPVILVGHSMGGVVISQIAENIPEKIEKLIYISGFVPSNHGSLLDEVKKAKGSQIDNEVVIDEINCEISLKLSSNIQQIFYNTCSEQEAIWATYHLQKQPYYPFINTVNISSEHFEKVPKVYIECLQDNAISIKEQRRMAMKLQCQIISLDTDHSPFFSAPEELCTALMNG